MNNKLVSIIIPTYKSNGGIINSIQSVINQTYNNIEIIVIDDNDPESDGRKNTEKLMQMYVDDPRVSYIKHDRNKNGAVARNTGIRVSKGDYIAFLDDDDTFKPPKIAAQVDYLESNIEKDCVYTSLAIDGEPCVVIPYENNALIPLLTERTRMFTSTLLFRRQSILEINGFTESFRRHQDFDLLIKFFSHGYKIGFIPEILVDYHSSGNNKLHGKCLEDLKSQYLSQFSYVIESLEVKKKGIKKCIIANNYASVLISYISSKDIDLAFKLLKKFFWVSPFDFISYIFFFIKCQIKKKINRLKY